MYPSHIHFAVLPGLTCSLGTSQKTKEEESTNKYQVQLILPGTWTNSQWAAPERKLSPSPPYPCQKPSTVRSYTSASPSHSWRVLCNGFLLSRLFPFEGLSRSLLCSSFSAVESPKAMMMTVVHAEARDHLDIHFVLPLNVMVMPLVLLPGAMWMSVACVTTEAHVDIWGLWGHLKSCWCLWSLLPLTVKGEKGLL